VSQAELRPERRHRRRTVRILTEYDTGNARRSELATTLGGGGLFIETAAPLPRDTTIVVRFRLAAGGPPHRVPGRVVWSHAPSSSGGIGRAAGMGVEFTDGAAAARVAKELEALP
jgi:Tfp pilus assembly protein PilZ